MRKTLGALTLGIALVATACSGSDDSAETTTTAAATTTASPDTTAAAVETTAAPDTTVPETTLVEPSTTAATGLALGLLTVDDLPEGWKRSADITVEDLSSLGEPPCEEAKVDAKVTERLKSTVGMQYEPVEGELRGIQELALEGDAAQLTKDLDAVYEALRSCIGKDIVAPEGEKVTYEDMQIGADVADQVFGASITALEPPDFQRTWRGYSVLARVGGKVFMINAFEVLPSPDAPATLTPEVFSAILTNAVARMRTAP